MNTISNNMEYSMTKKNSQRERSQMIFSRRKLGNENGSAIVLALMLLSLLTVMGIWSTNKSNIEALIAGNEVARKQTFFRTEGGVIEGAFAIEEAATGDLSSRAPVWLTEASIAPDMTDPDNWDFDEVGADDTAAPTSIDNEVGFCALDKGITAGDSLLMTSSSQVRTYAVYSFHDSRDGQSLMEVGYKRRF
jgi:hypothetical protein